MLGSGGCGDPTPGHSHQRCYTEDSCIGPLELKSVAELEAVYPDPEIDPEIEEPLGTNLSRSSSMIDLTNTMMMSLK